MPIYKGTQQINPASIHVGASAMQRVYVGDRLVWQKVSSFLPKYGLIYNWYAANDIRNICPIGHRIPTQDNFRELVSIYEGIYLAGNALKESGMLRWNDGNEGNNISNFTGVGAGIIGLYGLFEEFKNWGFYISIDCPDSLDFANVQEYGMYLFYNSSAAAPQYLVQAFEINKQAGGSIKTVRDATNDELLLADGTFVDNCTGNDGKIYRCVKIGSLIWLADNLSESKFQNGELILMISNSEEWTQPNSNIITATTEGDPITSFSNTGIMQSFVLHDYAYITKITAHFGFVGYPNFDVRMSIYTLEDGIPGVKVLDCTNIINSSWIEYWGSNDFEYYFNAQLAPGTYCIYIDYENIITNDIDNYATVNASSTNEYLEGYLSILNSGVWNNETRDLICKIDYKIAACAAPNYDTNNI